MEHEDALKRVCSYFNISIDDLLNRDTTNAISVARNFVYYILHIDLRLSINQISKILNRLPRNIKRRIAHIKYNVEHNKEYHKIYQELLPYIYDV